MVFLLAFSFLGQTSHTFPTTHTYTYSPPKSMSGANSSSGHIAYEVMANVQKAELSAYLRDELAGEAHGAQWKSQMRLLVQEALGRRAASGESVDAGDILAEVMPRVRAAVPEDVREGLFRRVAAQLNAS